MALELDEQVAAFRTRPLDAEPVTFVAADALTMNLSDGLFVFSCRGSGLRGAHT
jgi:transposase-like protein